MELHHPSKILKWIGYFGEPPKLPYSGILFFEEFTLRDAETSSKSMKDFTVELSIKDLEKAMIIDQAKREKMRIPELQSWTTINGTVEILEVKGEAKKVKVLEDLEHKNRVGLSGWISDSTRFPSSADQK